MTKTAYEQFDAATKGISGYAILWKGEFIGKVIFKRGNCRVYAYTHVHGISMERGIANGGGYDMKSAAFSAAINKTAVPKLEDKNVYKHIERFKKAVKDDGQHWDSALRDAGYTVLSVV